MASAGCIGLYFGIETGSQRMQQLTSKRLKLDGIERIFDVAQNLGIEITTSFITGYPEENREDQDASLDLMAGCFRRPQDACIPQLHILLPEPGTPLFAQHRPSLYGVGPDRPRVYIRSGRLQLGKPISDAADQH